MAPFLVIAFGWMDDYTATARLDQRTRTGAPGEDLFSRNFNWTLPILGLAGRSGLDLGLALSVNSLVWTKVNTNMIFDADHGFPGPSFRLGFPVLQKPYINAQSVLCYLLITPSGSRVELRESGTQNIFESKDSSYLKLQVNVNNLYLWTPDGTRMIYELKNHQYQCTEIKDRNGNYITVAYDSRGHITTVTDTLARVITFNYDAFQRLTSITQPSHIWASFEYGTRSIDTDFGNSLATVGPADNTVLQVLSKVTLDDGSSFNFDYTSWGQVHKIRNLAADGHLLNYVSYNLPLNASVAQTDCPRFTQRRDMAENWNSGNEVVTASYNAFDPNGNLAETTAPDGTLYRDYFFTSASDYRRGLPSETQVWVGGAQKKQTVVTWTQDDTVVAYQLNPRVIETNAYDDASNHRRVTTSYTSAFNLPSDIREYAADGNTLLRRTHTDYNLSSSYIDKRIIGLPSARMLYSGETESTLLSKVEFEYDSTAAGFLVDPGAITRHVNPGYTVGRGNLTNKWRFDVTEPTNLAKAVNYKTGYNTAGSAIFAEDPLGHRSTIGYTDSFSDGVNRNTFAYPTTVTDPDLKSSTRQYDYERGMAKVTTDPKGATLTTTFEPTTRRVTRLDSNSGGYTRYEYQSSMTEVRSFVLQSTSPTVEISSAQFFDGAGRVIATRRTLPGSTGGYSGQKFVYDVMGRLSQQSNPTEIDGAWVPAGDDAAAGWLYTLQSYDWKGRPRVTTNTDQTTRETTYGGCGCAGGETVTIRDEMNRRQRMTYDVLGRVVKTESLNWDGQSVYATRTDTYNARDQITTILVQQGSSGTGQQTVMTYDGHGRLKTRKAPIESTATVYDYYNDDAVQKVTDPRGATSNYVYNARHLVTGITYCKPTGCGSGLEEITAVPNTPPVGFNYDDAGNRLWMTDGLGRVDYVYNTWSQLTSETRIFDDFPGSSYALTYDYTVSGQLKMVTDPFGKAINYTYDNAGQMTAVTGSSFAGVTQYLSNVQYRAWGGLKHMSWGNGNNVDYGYNGRLQISSFGFTTYDYDADGRIHFVHFPSNPSFDRKYSYDHVGRLQEGLSGSDARGESYNPNDPPPYKQTYTYNVWDDMSGRTNRYWTLEENPFSATYVNNRNTAWSYNESGDVVQNPGGVYVYDSAGRMVKFNDTFLNQSYDGDGLSAKRVEFREGGLNDRATIYYVRSSLLGGQPITELKPDGFKRRTYCLCPWRRYCEAGEGSWSTRPDTMDKARSDHRRR